MTAGGKGGGHLSPDDRADIVMFVLLLVSLVFLFNPGLGVSWGQDFAKFYLSGMAGFVLGSRRSRSSGA